MKQKQAWTNGPMKVIFNRPIEHSITMKAISGMISYGACIFIAATILAMVFA